MFSHWTDEWCTGIKQVRVWDTVKLIVSSCVKYTHNRTERSSKWACTSMRLNWLLKDIKSKWVKMSEGSWGRHRPPPALLDSCQFQWREDWFTQTTNGIIPVLLYAVLNIKSYLFKLMLVEISIEQTSRQSFESNKQPLLLSLSYCCYTYMHMQFTMI